MFKVNNTNTGEKCEICSKLIGSNIRTTSSWVNFINSTRNADIFSDVSLPGGISNLGDIIVTEHIVFLFKLNRVLRTRENKNFNLF